MFKHADKLLVFFAMLSVSTHNRLDLVVLAFIVGFLLWRSLCCVGWSRRLCLEVLAKHVLQEKDVKPDDKHAWLEQAEGKLEALRNQLDQTIKMQGQCPRGVNPTNKQRKIFQAARNLVPQITGRLGECDLDCCMLL